MARVGCLLTWVVWGLALLAAGPVRAEPTLEKIKRTGLFTVGTRTGSPPFAFYNRNNQWVGFSIDLARAIHRKIEKQLGRPIRFELKETLPVTRIPLLASGAVDLVAETMTKTRTRSEEVDFSLTYFVTGAQFLVKTGSPIRGIREIAGKRVGTQQGATNERILRERVPGVKLVVFQDQPAAFTALVQGKIDAYTNDGVQLAGLKAKVPNPQDYQIVGDFYSYEPYGLAMRRGDANFRLLVDTALMEQLEGGEYFTLYERWFGAKGEVPYPLDGKVRNFLLMQVIPR